MTWIIIVVVVVVIKKLGHTLNRIEIMKKKKKPGKQLTKVESVRTETRLTHKMIIIRWILLHSI